jgi:ribosomal protein S18 acetylase RimI-like enzyme
LAFIITEVDHENTKDLSAISTLFNAYATWLSSHGIDLTFQSFATELSTLPGLYSSSNGGILLLARTRSSSDTKDGESLGCVALRPLQPPAIAELKRLYVSPSARGLGLGRALVSEVLRRVKGIGYEEVKLDTLLFMSEARRLYIEFGFEECEAYDDTPLEGTVFYEVEGWIKRFEW